MAKLRITVEEETWHVTATLGHEVHAALPADTDETFAVAAWLADMERHERDAVLKLAHRVASTLYSD